MRNFRSLGSIRSVANSNPLVAFRYRSGVRPSNVASPYPDFTRGARRRGAGRPRLRRDPRPGTGHHLRLDLESRAAYTGSPQDQAATKAFYDAVTKSARAKMAQKAKAGKKVAAVTGPDRLAGDGSGPESLVRCPRHLP